ncbi:uncharacterized protein LOC129792254 [Lutzomyia longipalpis]|uniref:uncharacterized protein LOC129792254 n=1 Tax=Lutzomyia longipalpis TaxID=7200 RepID=UPI0024835A67|nr:uncharacterized protein LOC129792254 [Lutzomyia longipalpis]
MTFKLLFVLAFTVGTFSVLYANKMSCETCNGLMCLVSSLRGIKEECLGENDYCISAFCNSLIMAKGCASSTKLPQCSSPEELSIYSCDEERCASQRPIARGMGLADVRVTACVQCNQKDSQSCSVNAFTLPPTACSSANGETQCYTKMDNGLISRGCLNQLSQGEQLYCLSEDFGENCAICNVNGCNRDIFPDNRLKCHQCDSATDPTCNIAKSTRTATFCDDYSQEMQCITLIRNDKRVQRMCSKTPFEQCNNGISCKRCNTNGCNNEGITINEISQLDQCPSPTPAPSSTTPTRPTTSTTTQSTTTPASGGSPKIWHLPLIAILGLVLINFTI